MALVEQVKKGGPYTKKEQDDRRQEVFKLHFEKGYSAMKISEVLNMNRNTINEDIRHWYSELAPQVQQLREIRDNVILSTHSGAMFMSAFNQFYYTFSPTIADWERQNPIFKEAVRIAITPLVTTLSILNYVDIDSESDMIGYGIGVILLNIGMYVTGPIFVLSTIQSKFKI